VTSGKISSEPRYLYQILAKRVFGTWSAGAVGHNLIEDFALLGGEKERGRIGAQEETFGRITLPGFSR